nr:alcohol dehydrogenase catalytic domain-containing protein [uncultured Schumannella sp.]
MLLPSVSWMACAPSLPVASPSLLHIAVSFTILKTFRTQKPDGETRMPRASQQDRTRPARADELISRRVVYHRFGGPEVLDIETRPVPTPAPDEVLVRVAAAGVNPVDWKIFSGAPLFDDYDRNLPSGTGYDFSGTIAAIGDAVPPEWQLGDRVFGGLRFHAMADHLVIQPRHLARVPNDVPLVVAGALNVVGRTAMASVRSQHLSPADTVLVSGAAGGVGILTAQLAAHTGARVIGTASPAIMLSCDGSRSNPSPTAQASSTGSATPPLKESPSSLTPSDMALSPQPSRSAFLLDASTPSPTTLPAVPTRSWALVALRPASMNSPNLSPCWPRGGSNYPLTQPTRSTRYATPTLAPLADTPPGRSSSRRAGTDDQADPHAQRTSRDILAAG